MTNYKIIGAVGLANLTLLLLIVVYRTYRWYVGFEPGKDLLSDAKKMGKKLGFHALLAMSVIVDVPCYVSFLVHNGYQARTYAFHRLQGMFIFMAFSMTIHDWSIFLLNIDELQPIYLFMRTGWLIAINLGYMGVSMWSCIQLLVDGNLSGFANSPLYTAGLFMQMLSCMLLMGMMLHAGMKLSNRLASVVKRGSAGDRGSADRFSDDDDDDDDEETAGDGGYTRDRDRDDTLSASEAGERWRIDSKRDGTMDGSLPSVNFSASMIGKPDRQRSGATTSTNSLGRTSRASSSRRISRATSGHGMDDDYYPDDHDDNDSDEYFRQCIFRLNVVVTITLLTTLSSIGFLFAGIIMGDSSNQDSFFGPPLVDFTFHFWVPLWGPVLAMLYLARSNSRLSKKRAADAERQFERSAKEMGAGGGGDGGWMNWLRCLIDHDAQENELDASQSGQLSKPLLFPPDHSSSPAPTAWNADDSPMSPPPISTGQESQYSITTVPSIPAQPTKLSAKGGGGGGVGGDALVLSPSPVSSQTQDDMSFDVNTLDMSMAGGDPDVHFSASLKRVGPSGASSRTASSATGVGAFDAGERQVSSAIDPDTSHALDAGDVGDVLVLDNIDQSMATDGGII
jgi:hypothetical protein